MNIFKKAFKISSIIIGVYFIPIFIYGNLYRDDNARAVYQYMGWDLDGRPVTNEIMYWINLGNGLTDIAPLSYIISIILCALCCAITCSKILNNGSVSIIASSTFLFLSPLFLQNLSYRFDILTMSLSILFSVMPFLITNCNEKWYSRKVSVFIFSALCVQLTLNTYQASLPVFYGSILLGFIANKNIRKYCLTMIFGGTISLIIYKVIISPIYVGGGYAGARAETIELSKDSISHFIGNIYEIKGILSILHGEYVTYFLVPVFFVFIISMLLFLLDITKSINNTLLFSISLIAFLASFLIFFVLKKPVYELRMMIWVNFIIMMVSIVAVCYTEKIKQLKSISFVLITPMVLLFFSIMSNYSNMQRLYSKYEESLVSAIYSDVSRLGINNGFYLNGYPKEPRLVSLIYKNHPVLRAISGGRLGISTGQFILSDAPFLNATASYEKIPNKLECNNILMNYNGIYTIIKYNDNNVVEFNDVKCN